jgi:hypothetical protein
MLHEGGPAVLLMAPVGDGVAPMRFRAWRLRNSPTSRDLE